MTLHIAHVDKEFMDGGFEIVVNWIKDDLSSAKTIEQIHESCDLYTFGRSKRKLTEEEFFIAYKSAELVHQDDVAFQKKKKSNQMFRRQ